MGQAVHEQYGAQNCLAYLAVSSGSFDWACLRPSRHARALALPSDAGASSPARVIPFSNLIRLRWRTDHSGDCQVQLARVWPIGRRFEIAGWLTHFHSRRTHVLEELRARSVDSSDQRDERGGRRGVRVSQEHFSVARELSQRVQAGLSCIALGSCPSVEKCAHVCVHDGPITTRPGRRVTCTGHRRPRCAIRRRGTGCNHSRNENHKQTRHTPLLVTRLGIDLIGRCALHPRGASKLRSMAVEQRWWRTT